MDVRLTSEQQQLRDAAAKLADELGPGSVADLDDEVRRARLEKTVEATGWRCLRTDEASEVEALSSQRNSPAGLVDVPFIGPVLADDLQRLSGRAAAAGGIRARLHRPDPKPCRSGRITPRARRAE